MGQPIWDFHRRDPQSSPYVNSGFRPESERVKSTRPRMEGMLPFAIVRVAGVIATGRTPTEVSNRCPQRVEAIAKPASLKNTRSGAS